MTDEKPSVTDTLAMLGTRAAALASQLEALRRRVSFVQDVDQAALGYAQASARASANACRFVEERARLREVRNDPRRA